MNILLTGGLGYIGSLIAIDLLNHNINPIIIDNCSTSKIKTLDRLKKITNHDINFYKCDLCNFFDLKNTLEDIEFDGVVHLAGYKSIQESMYNPIKYYFNNLNSASNILKIVKEKNVNLFIFSSSATVYGEPSKLPLTENHSLNPINVYGKTKLVIENMLKDICSNDEKFKAVCLRYFNPLGSYKRGLIGEDPAITSDNLVSQICNVIFEKQSYLNIYGSKLNTFDGSAVRDFIHISDLTYGHISALNWMKDNQGFHIFNLGRGNGNSVFEVASLFEKFSKREIKYKFFNQRTGEVPEYYCSNLQAKKSLNWSPKYNLENMVEDTYLWQLKLRNFTK